MTHETAAPPTAPALPVNEGLDARTRWAQGITNAIEPKNIILAVVPIIGLARNGLPGLLWAAFAVVFAAIVPTWFIRRGVREDRWTDRHVGERKKRLIVIPFIMCSVLVSAVVMLVAGAPRPLLAMVAAMFATLVSIMAITVVWKVSVHTAVSAGAITVLAIALSPWWAVGYLLVALVAWSRVVLRDHTPAQTIVGTVVGTVTAGLVFWLCQ